ncbi:Cytochrome P450 71A24 [Bienertia sinuspersici]
MAIALNKFLEKLPFQPVAIMLFSIFLLFLYKWLSTTYNSKRNSPPSPLKLPILGNLLQLGNLPHRSLRSLSQQYGELMLLHIGSKPTLVVSSASAAQEIMKTHDVVFANRPKMKVATKILYGCKDIAFAEYGEYWRKIKSLCMLHMFSNSKVSSFRRVREEETALMVEDIRRSITSSVVEVNLSDIIVRLINDVLCRAAFGRKYWEEEGCSNVRALLDDLSEVFGTFNIEDFIPWLGWIDCILGTEGKATRVAKVLDDWIEKIIEEHLDHHNKKGQDDEEIKGEKVQDFVDVLLEIQKDNLSTLSRDSIKAILLDMIAAGTHTTYTLLEWAMAELLLHPTAMKALYEEVRRTVKDRELVSENDLESMEYLKAVIKETLRLHPPLPLLLFRESSQDVKINEYDVTTGTQVIVNAWAIHRNLTYWEDPEEFHPERFVNSLVDFKGQNFNFIPFGSGRRGCPGISFGIIKAELVLANLVYHFDWKLPEGKAFNMAEKLGNAVRKRDSLVKHLLPSPPKLPILGNTHQLGTRPHRHLLSMSEIYGDLMMIQLCSVLTLVVSSSRAAREIMVTHDITFANRPTSKQGLTLLYSYKDVGTPYGEYWRQMKSICVLHLLSNKRVQTFRSVREEETSLLIDRIKQAESSPVNLSDMFMEFSQFTNDTICRVAFGRKCTRKEDFTNFNKIMKESNKLLLIQKLGI